MLNNELLAHINRINKWYAENLQRQEEQKAMLLHGIYEGLTGEKEEIGL